MKGYLVTNKFEVGATPWHFSVYENTLYVPDVQLKIYHWQDRQEFGLVEKLSDQEFKDVKEFHSRDLRELALNDKALVEICDLFRQIEPMIPTMRELYRRLGRLDIKYTYKK